MSSAVILMSVLAASAFFPDVTGPAGAAGAAAPAMPAAERSRQAQPLGSAVARELLRRVSAMYVRFPLDDAVVQVREQPGRAQVGAGRRHSDRARCLDGMCASIHRQRL